MESFDDKKQEICFLRGKKNTEFTWREDQKTTLNSASDAFFVSNGNYLDYANFCRLVILSLVCLFQNLKSVRKFCLDSANIQIPANYRYIWSEDS